MKTKIIIIMTMLMGAISAYAQRDFPRLSADKDTLWVITECKKDSSFITHDTKVFRTDTWYDTLTTYAIAPEIRRFMTQAIADSIRLGSLPVLQDSLVPRSIHLWGYDQHIITRLTIKHDQLSSEQTSEQRSQWFILGVVVLISLIWTGISTKFTYDHPGRRDRILMTVLTVTLLSMVWAFRLEFPMDFIVVCVICIIPNELVIIFAFRRRGRKANLKKKGHDVHCPLRVYGNGDMLLAKWMIATQETAVVCFCDKDYRMLENQPFEMLEATRDDGTKIVKKRLPHATVFGIINDEYDILLPVKYTFISEFQHDLAKITALDGLSGYCNRQGEIIIPCQYKNASDFKAGIAEVEKDGRTFYIEINGKEFKTST